MQQAHRFGASGGSVLRLTVFRKFEVFGFVAGLVVKIPACAKPRPVICKFIQIEVEIKTMKIFPSSFYEFKLINDQSETIERLKRRTENSENLVSKFTDKSFVGKINGNNFKIISSNIGKGAFCTLNGNINQKNGEVFIEINKPFKILLSIFMFFPIIALMIQIITRPTEFNPIFIIVCLGQILIIRFFFIGIFYRILSKQSINKLSDILDTEWIRKK